MKQKASEPYLCNQCHEGISLLIEDDLIFRDGKENKPVSHTVIVCRNQACPNFGLLQVDEAEL